MSQLKSLRIPDPVYQAIEDLAYAQRISLTDCILRLIRTGLDVGKSAMNNIATDEEMVDHCRGNGNMIAKMIYATFPNDAELLQDIADLEKLNFSLDQLNEGLNTSPIDNYDDWLRSEVLRLGIARWPVGNSPS